MDIIDVKDCLGIGQRFSHGANQVDYPAGGSRLGIYYVVITTPSNTLGKEPPIAQVNRFQLCLTNHHIIISQRHATPTLDQNVSR
jgi:hypothetical protein